MRRYLLPAALLLLALALAWILRGSRPVAAPAAAPHMDAAAEGGAPAPEAATVEREAARTDQGLTAPAAAPAPGGGWQLSGRAWSERGEPVAGVTIRLVDGVGYAAGSSEARYFVSTRPDYAAAVTDADGRYLIRLPAPPEPSLRWWFSASPGILCDRHAGSPAVKSLPREFREHGGECDLVLRGGPGVTGRVLTPDGAPAPFAMVTSNAGLVWSAGADGSFRAPVPLRRDLDLSFQHESGVLRLKGLQASAEADLALGDLRLRGPGHLAGRVVLPDGSPAPQLRINFTARNLLQTRAADRSASNWSDDGRQEAWIVTDAAGAFHLPGLTIDQFVPECQAMGTAIRLQKPGDPAGTRHWIQSGPESDGHLLVLNWRLLLVDVPEYEPGMPSLHYVIQATAAEGGDAPPASEFRLLAQGLASTADFPIVFLYDSATWIRIVAAAGTQATGTALLPMQPEPWLTRAALPLEPFGATGKILVRASSADDSSITGLTAELRDPHTGAYVLGAWPSGVEEGLEFANVPAGVWSLTLSTRDYFADAFVLAETMPVEVRAGETREIDWRPREGGMLQIVVDTDGTGSAEGVLPEITATVLQGPAHVGNLLTVVEDGRRRPARPQFPPSTVMMVAGVLEPGTYRLRFEAAGFAPAEASIEVRAADVVRLEARLNAAP